LTTGAGHEVKPLSELRRTEPRSAEIFRPEGIVLTFHVSLYKVEPCKAVRARNLLSKDNARAADADEVMPVRPDVPLVNKPISFACLAERLARARTSPDPARIRPAGETERVRPDADASKEMALGIPGNVSWPHVADVAFIDIPVRDRSGFDEFS
jgi:hypothetical protein